MTDGPESESPRLLQTVTRVFNIISALQRLDGAGVTQLATELDMAKSSVYNYLRTMEEHRFVVRREGIYRLSYRFLHLGEYVRGCTPVYVHGTDELDKLAHETGRFAHLSTEQHGLGVDLYKAKGQEAIGTRYQRSKFQHPDYLHFSATGKAILAHLPPERVEWIIDEYGLVKRTAATITEPETLFEELDQIREQGYAVNREEEIEGIRAVGAPILTPSGDVLGSVSISGPAHRMRSPEYEADMITAITDTANRIQVNINTESANGDVPPFDT
jgi:DNA-binding IclR family transcriptional regulator